MARSLHRHSGVTLVELVMFIVLMGIAFGALMLTLSQLTRTSADPLIRKQALAIAESLLEEVELMPFTFCDPDDPNASNTTVTATTGCSVYEDSPFGPEAGEVRNDAVTPFDNPSDYNGSTITGMVAGYSALVTVTQAGLGGIVANEALRINVTVTGPNNATLSLDGYRARYAPWTAP